MRSPKERSCAMASEPAVGAAEWRLAILDIDSGGGICEVTLRSGVKLEGRPDPKLSQSFNTLFMRHEHGWHVIDWTEIAAITGRVATQASWGRQLGAEFNG